MNLTTVKYNANPITARLSDEMINKLEWACTAYIKELIIKKKYEDENGNINKYKWLYIYDTSYSENDSESEADSADSDWHHEHIQHVIYEMFHKRNCALLWPIISDYFVQEDINMLRTLNDKYNIKVLHYTQEDCDKKWRNLINQGNINNPMNILNMIFKMEMYEYMQMNPNLLENILLTGIDTSTQLK